MTIGMSSYGSSATSLSGSPSPTDCNRIARNATYDFALLAFNEIASGSSDNNALYVEFHNAIYNDCMGY
ncbi:MAG: hypothetical protein ACTH5N_05155 [Psychroflexus halocasei]